jgi:hypothetical protein
MLFTRNTQSDVHVAGSTLVATFANANPPLIWKFDLARNHSFTIALHGEDGDDWELGVTSPKGEFYPVARFASREDADEAFFKLQKGLAKSQISLPKRILKIILLVALGLGAFILLLNILRSYAIHSALESNFARMPSAQMAPAAIKEGVPQSADDVLQAPR